jgi:hypothetical protein
LDAPDWHQTFEVAVVTRGDLTEVGLSPQQIDDLSDADMQAIAEKMADLYSDNGYWQDLAEAYRIIVSKIGAGNEQETHFS